MPHHSWVHKMSCGGLLYTAVLLSLGACYRDSSGAACDRRLEVTPLDDEERSFLQLLNQYRKKNGLGMLAECASLNSAAQSHSEDMQANDYFDHAGLDGSQPWDRACDACYALGCGPRTGMGEILAFGNVDAGATLLQWQSSPVHNEIMLKGSFKVVGIGRALDDVHGSYWTVLFGGESEPSCH